MKNSMEQSLKNFITDRTEYTVNKGYYVFETQKEQIIKKMMMQESIINLIHYLNHFDKRNISTKDAMILIIQNLAILTECLGLSLWFSGIVEVFNKDGESLEAESNLRFQKELVLQKELMFGQNVHHPKYCKVSHAKANIKLLKRYIVSIISRLHNEYQLYYAITYQIPFSEFVTKYVL